MIMKVGLAVLLCSLGSQEEMEEIFAPAVQLQADGKAVDISKDLSYSGPWVVDRDGDGKRDLIVTSIMGKMRWYKNVGADTKPVYEHQGLVQVGGEDVAFHNW